MVESDRLHKEIDLCANFERRKGLTAKYVLEGIHARYKALKLDKIERWKNGTLPHIYPNPKHKAPIEKTRIIASYFNFPLKKLYKLASKAGTWLLRQLPKTHPHFTLHNVGDVKTRLIQGIEHIQKPYGVNTEVLCFQSDVKQMYTNL
jgi:hypothetical protein